MKMVRPTLTSIQNRHPDPLLLSCPLPEHGYEEVQHRGIREHLTILSRQSICVLLPYAPQTLISAPGQKIAPTVYLGCIERCMDPTWRRAKMEAGAGRAGAGPRDLSIF